MWQVEGWDKYIYINITITMGSITHTIHVRNIRTWLAWWILRHILVDSARNYYVTMLRRTWMIWGNHTWWYHVWCITSMVYMIWCNQEKDTMLYNVIYHTPFHKTIISGAWFQPQKTYYWLVGNGHHPNNSRYGMRQKKLMLESAYIVPCGSVLQL